VHRADRHISKQGPERTFPLAALGFSRRFQDRAVELLDLIEAANEIRDFSGVADFHALKGDRAGTYSMHVNGNWCITFKFIDGHAYEVDFEDYH
jgi:proteic killer suppression protein